MNALALALRERAVELIRGTGCPTVTNENVTTNPTWRAQYRDMLADLRRRTLPTDEKHAILTGMIEEIDAIVDPPEPEPASPRVRAQAIGFQSITLDYPPEAKSVGSLVREVGHELEHQRSRQEGGSEGGDRDTGEGAA